jgi:putative DNA-invertase from lambdoid prophage Rac
VPLADRPEGGRLLAAVRPGDVVITSRLDRAFRSAADALMTLEELKAQSVGAGISIG